MSLGIGLGAFVDGFKSGYGIRADMDDRKVAQEDRARRRKIEDEEHAWRREDRAYDVEQRERERDTREAIDAVNDEAREEFKKRVEAGEADANEFDEFWTTFALPKMRQELLLNGDVDSATKLGEWGETAAAKKGGRLFTSAMLKSQTGDYGGALDDAIAAAKVQGYLDHGFELGDKEEIKDSSGAIVGYRVTIKDGEGNEMMQDIALDDVEMTIATFANPAAAWESQQAKRAKDAGRQEELDDYEKKKAIDAKYSDDGGKRRTDAITTLRKRSENSLGGPDEPLPFDQLGREEQEAAIAAEIALQAGSTTPAAPSPQVVVDTLNGSQVTGLGDVPKAQPGGSSGAVGLGSVPAPRLASPDPALNMPSHAQVVKSAADMMVAGKDPNEIASMLSGMGIDKSMWPAGLVNGTNPGGTARTAPAQ